MPLIPIQNNPIHVDIVSASPGSYSFGFEDCVAGENITAGLPGGSDNIFTSKMQGTWVANVFCVTSSLARTGTRSFRNYYGGACSGWFNATYSQSDYMTNFTWYYRTGTWIQDFHFYFYNATLGLSEYLLQIGIGSGSTTVYYVDELGGTHTIGNVVNNAFSYLGWNIDNDIGDCTYFAGASHVHGVVHRPKQITSNYRIDRLYITTYAQSSMTAYMDDLTWKLSSGYPAFTDTEFGRGYGFEDQFHKQMQPQDYQLVLITSGLLKKMVDILLLILFKHHNMFNQDIEHSMSIIHRESQDGSMQHTIYMNI